jgi:hypothetical protein
LVIGEQVLDSLGERENFSDVWDFRVEQAALEGHEGVLLMRAHASAIKNLFPDFIFICEVLLGHL